MSGKNIGYIRVSSALQNDQRQLEGLKLDKTFTDKISGKSTQRPALTEMLSYVRDGDTVIVHSMDRLARNLDDLRLLVRDLTNRQVKIKFIKESLEFTGEDSPMSNLLLSVMGEFAEFERTLIKERQLEGIAIAKKQGLYKGRKKTLTPEQQNTLLQAAKNGVSKTEIGVNHIVCVSLTFAFQ
jgi:DNA invertase Pin-like site-specific DNA recombinase